MSNNQLNTNEYLSKCDPKDVISFKDEKWTSINKIREILYSALVSSGIKSMTDYIVKWSDFKSPNNINNWFKQGEECEILRAGSQGWQKGKIKINVTLEFIPDEVEENKSPLDDIREAGINNSQ